MLINPKTDKPYTDAQLKKLTEEQRQAAEQYTAELQAQEDDEIQSTDENFRFGKGIKENEPDVTMISGELIAVKYIAAEDTTVFEKDRITMKFVSYMNGKTLRLWVYPEMLQRMDNKELIERFNPEDGTAPVALPCRIEVINTIAGKTTYVDKNGKVTYHTKTRQNFSGIYPISSVAQAADMRIGNAINVAKANNLDNVDTAKILASII